MSIVVVPMAERHVDAVAEIEKASFSMPWSPAMIRNELENPLCCYLAAEEDGALVGYAGMQIVLDEGYITNIATALTHRRRGVGALLLAALRRIALAKKLTFLTLEVRRSNAPAIALYQKHGFSLVGERPGYYEKPREDALLMTLHLPLHISQEE